VVAGVGVGQAVKRKRNRGLHNKIHPKAWRGNGLLEKKKEWGGKTGISLRAGDLYRRLNDHRCTDERGRRERARDL